MLDAIITWSLRNRLIVIVAWLGVAVASAIAFVRLPIDAFPDTTLVQVQVNTIAPALSPLEIERQITARVEQGISGLPDLVEVPSLSRLGLSQVTVVFEDGTDISFRASRCSRSAKTSSKWSSPQRTDSRGSDSIINAVRIRPDGSLRRRRQPDEPRRDRLRSHRR